MQRWCVDTGWCWSCRLRIRGVMGVSCVAESLLVVGGSGYTGAIAARLVDRHPAFELTAVTSRSDAGRRLTDLYPHHRVDVVLEELDLDVHGDVDAKSGVSGAGRTPSNMTQFVAMDENVVPYGVGAHRHMPEIDQELAALGAPVTATFTAHLVPVDQGELVSCYGMTSEPWSQARVDDAYGEWALEHPFVELAARPPGVRDVRDTNVCSIWAQADDRTGRVLVFAAIDNLWKGAASQAIQNLNLMF